MFNPTATVVVVFLYIRATQLLLKLMNYNIEVIYVLLLYYNSLIVRCENIQDVRKMTITIERQTFHKFK